VLTRGLKPVALPPGVGHVVADAADEAALAGVVEAGGYDVAVSFVIFDAPQAEAAVRAFGGRVKQLVFISTAAVYEKPPRHHVITEKTPRLNPFWDYARRKIEAEDVFIDAHARAGFPATIVRPSYTYGEGWIPTSMGSDYTTVWRLRRTMPVVIPGDGSSLFVLTHASDFARGLVGLFGRPEAIGEDFHITSDEVLSWHQIFSAIAEAAGTPIERVHVPSEFIARVDARRGGSLLGDKAWSAVFDNSKLKRLVPGFAARVPFAEGVRRSIEWIEADPSRQILDANATVEAVLAAWRRAEAAAFR
jgi:nucleoside-diphosphate-sugar epimerase